MHTKLHRFRRTDSAQFWFVYFMREDGTYSGFYVMRWTGSFWKVIYSYSTVSRFATLDDLPILFTCGEIRESA